MNRLIILIVLLFNVNSIFSQISNVKGAVGRWVIVNITPEEARVKALEEAKRDALKMAGVEEMVYSSDILVSQVSTVSKYQKFSSFSTLEMRGGVVAYEIVNSTVIKMADSNLYAVVTINAKIKKYRSTPDIGFKLCVRLPSKSFKNGAHLEFNVETTQKGYLTIFLIDDKYGVSMLFPNTYECVNAITESKNMKFPVDSHIEYTLEKNSSDEVEQNLLVFVYTKFNVKPQAKLTYESLLEWIYEIEPCERCVLFEYISIL